MPLFSWVFSRNLPGFTEDKMPHDLRKAYDPTAIENPWAERELGYGKE